MRRHIKLYWANPYIQGGFFLTVSTFFVSVLNFLFNFFAARVLGPSNYGELTTYYSYISLFSVPMAVFSNIIIQRISSSTANSTAYAKSFTLQFKQLLLRLSPLIVLALLGAPFISSVTNLSFIISCFLIPTILLGLIGNFYSSVLQGLKLFFLYSLFSVGGVTLKFISILIPVFKYGALNEVVIFQVVTNVFVIWLAFTLLSKLLQKHYSDEPHSLTKLKRLLVSRQFIITFLSVLSFAILSNLDVMYVKKYFQARETGLYSSWSLFAKIILYSVGPLSQISFVFFASNTKRLVQNKVLLLSLAILTLVGVGGYVSYTSLGTFLISVLFGEQFLEITPYLGLASIFGFFYAAISLLNTYFLAKKNVFSLILICFLPLYLIALLFIPKNLLYLMWTNIAFAAVVALSYLGAFFISTRQSQV